MFEIALMFPFVNKIIYFKKYHIEFHPRCQLDIHYLLQQRQGIVPQSQDHEAIQFRHEKINFSCLNFEDEFLVQRELIFDESRPF